MESNVIPAGFQLDQPETSSSLPSGFQLDSDKYGTVGQQVKTGLEGAAQGVAGPLATAAETHLLGVKPEDIAGRAKANPVIHGASQAAGLIGGSMIPGLGEYTLGSKIAEAGEAVAGGSAAIKAATEMALIQASDETSKWLQNDPNQSVQSAIANIGLSAALGGAGGAVFGKAGSALRSLGDAPEEVARGIRMNLNPLKINEPLFPENYTPPEAPNKAVVKSFGLGQRIAQAIKDNASNAASEGLGASLGAGLGHATGIPGAGWAGALIGERAISPILKSIIPAIGKSVMDMDLSGPGFASAINMAEQAVKGRLLVEKAANSVFGSAFGLSAPDKDLRDKLDKRIRDLQNNPQGTIDVLNNNLDHYMPGHAMSLGQTVGQAIQYLNTVKPNVEKQSPLDSVPTPTPEAKTKYNQALSIAENPLTVMNNIKQGTLTSQHIAHLASMYPALYDQMKSALMDSMTDHLSKQESIPYKTRLGISLFMGQPLDSSMKPASIQASIPAQPQQIPGGAPGVKNVKHQTIHLDNIAKLDATPSQAKAINRSLKD